GAALKKHDSDIIYIIKTEMPWANNESDTQGEWQQMISNYQYYNDIKVSGRLDSFTIARLSRTPQEINNELRINMERVRWMEQNIGDQYIVVDVPVMELFFRKGGGNVMHMRTVVGKPERQTPSLVANMANVVINPPWGVPPTIMKKDVLPGMSKSGMKYLAKKGLKIYDHKGNVVDASVITEKNYKRYIFKQAPGDDNSLGYVKFNLPNKWDIYLHDTPHRDDFPKRNRFLSSGCVRLEQPQQMALYILGTLENKRYTQERLDSVIQTHKTRWEILKTRIPVHIVYLTVFEDTTGQHLRFIRDIYQRDDRVLAALK
ncbi:MAG: L,D-transpeptidase family protein, partial [Bacteroidetes bacterium]|nr:L,D-transpeptidase family protein [Bacteroidota bacterium]